jgi:DNA-directed RNA polymerase specialized sigma24 family protein
MRRRIRRLEVPEAEATVPALACAHPAEQEDRAIALDIHDGLRDCLRGMRRSRRVAVACHLQGYSVPDTARFVGWTTKKAEHLTRRGLADLRLCLSGKGLTP